MKRLGEKDHDLTVPGVSICRIDLYIPATFHLFPTHTKYYPDFHFWTEKNLKYDIKSPTATCPTTLVVHDGKNQYS